MLPTCMLPAPTTPLSQPKNQGIWIHILCLASVGRHKMILKLKGQVGCKSLCCHSFLVMCCHRQYPRTTYQWMDGKRRLILTPSSYLWSLWNHQWTSILVLYLGCPTTLMLCIIRGLKSSTTASVALLVTVSGHFMVFKLSLLSLMHCSDIFPIQPFVRAVPFHQRKPSGPTYWQFLQRTRSNFLIGVLQCHFPLRETSLWHAQSSRVWLGCTSILIQHRDCDLFLLMVCGMLCSNNRTDMNNSQIQAIFWMILHLLPIHPRMVRCVLHAQQPDLLSQYPLQVYYQVFSWRAHPTSKSPVYQILIYKDLVWPCTQCWQLPHLTHCSQWILTTPLYQCIPIHLTCFLVKSCSTKTRYSIQTSTQSCIITMACQIFPAFPLTPTPLGCQTISHSSLHQMPMHLGQAIPLATWPHQCKVLVKSGLSY